MKKPQRASSVKPSALFLTPEAPYPIAGGGALRSASFLEYLARRYTVDVINFVGGHVVDPDLREDPACAFPAGMVRDIHTIRLPYHSRNSVARAARNLKRYVRGVPSLNDRYSGFGDSISNFLEGRSYQLAVIEHFWCVSYYDQIAPHADSVVLDLHNIESVLHGKAAGVDHWPAAALHRGFERAALALERIWLPRYNSVLVTSENDAARVNQIAPESRVQVYPNTIPSVPVPEVTTYAEAIIFTGNMEYHPNVGAVRYFRSAIWPRLRDRFPEVTWLLAGKNPEAVSKYLDGDPRIRALGPVDDAIRIIATAQVAIAPLLVGSGTRFKILEAWAAGVPVVSTSVGAEGLCCNPGEHLLVGDSPADFADAVRRLLESPALRHQIGRAGRALYESKYTWESGWRELDRLGFGGASA